MNAVRWNGNRILAAVLGVLMLAAVAPAAMGQRVSPTCGCGKTLGRGGGYPVAVHVVLAGKPVAAAVVTVNTIHGVPVKSAKTDSTGLANTKLPPGDYIVMAKTKTASGMVQATVTATTPVTVTVTITPNQ